MANSDKFVVSLGGSLIVPNEIDTAFLQKFHKVILEELKTDKTFLIVAGGGKLARKYQNAADQITSLTRDDLDWLGIHSTHLNAHLIRTIFRDVAHPKIITHPQVKESATEAVIVGAGWRPGWSTDYMAVQFAKRYGAKTVINLSNIDFVYDKDPTKFSDARPIKEISWTDFRKIVGEVWDPGLSLPFDPIASKLAHKSGIDVVILNGQDLTQFSNFLENKPFQGTVIS
jgi:uridylate kinase